MKNIRIRIVILCGLFSLVFFSPISGQGENKDPLEQIFPEKYKNIQPTAKRIISEFAEVSYQYQAIVHNSERNALRKMTNYLVHTEKLPDLEFNHGEVWLKTVLSVTATVIDVAIKESVKDFPILGTFFQVGEKIYDKYYQKPQKLMAEYKRIKSKNELLTLLDKAGDAIENSSKNFEVDFRNRLLDEYASIPESTSERIVFLEGLEKLQNRLKNNPPSEEEVELICYQLLLSEMFSSKTENPVGYMDIYTLVGDSHLEYFDGIPNMVSISIKAGSKDFNDKIEKKLSELIQSNRTRYQSVLELERIPKIVTSVFLYKEGIVSLIPVVSIQNVTMPTWSTEKPFINYLVHEKISHGKVGKAHSSGKIGIEEKNKKGVLYTDIVQEPFKYINNRKSSFPVFKTYHPDNRRK